MDVRYPLGIVDFPIQTSFKGDVQLSCFIARIISPDFWHLRINGAQGIKLLVVELAPLKIGKSWGRKSSNVQFLWLKSWQYVKNNWNHQAKKVVLTFQEVWVFDPSVKWYKTKCKTDALKAFPSRVNGNLSWPELAEGKCSPCIGGKS